MPPQKNIPTILTDIEPRIVVKPTPSKPVRLARKEGFIDGVKYAIDAIRSGYKVDEIETVIEAIRTVGDNLDETEDKKDGKPRVRGRGTGLGL